MADVCRRDRRLIVSRRRLRFFLHTSEKVGADVCRRLRFFQQTSEKMLPDCLRTLNRRLFFAHSRLFLCVLPVSKTLTYIIHI